MTAMRISWKTKHKENILVGKKKYFFKSCYSCSWRKETSEKTNPIVTLIVIPKAKMLTTGRPIWQLFSKSPFPFISMEQEFNV